MATQPSVNAACTRWLSAFVLSLFCGFLHAADLLPDPNTAIWAKVRASLFHDRSIADSADQFIAFTLPARAEDAAVVPIRIAARTPQQPERFIKTVYLVIDNNPSPVAAVFHLTPAAGRADLETRVRVEAYTYVRAIVETNDGKLYMTRHFIKASGGCSAPAGADPAAAQQGLGKMKLILEDTPQIDKPSLVQLMIRHPNTSGLAVDQITHLSAPPRFIRKIDVRYAGEPIMQAEVDFSVSENPNFRFYFTPRGSGELTAVAEDTSDMVFRTTLAVRPQ